jgi:hypothetical protein
MGLKSGVLILKSIRNNACWMCRAKVGKNHSQLSCSSELRDISAGQPILDLNMRDHESKGFRFLLCDV